MKLTNITVKQILNQYNIGEFQSKTLVYNKWNTSYKIKTTQGKYLLKILSFQNEKELKMELKIMHRVKEQLPCVFPILSKKNTYFIRFQGFIVLIKNFVIGKPILRGQNLSDKNLAQLGKYYGLMHTTKPTSGLIKKDLYTDLQKFFENLAPTSEEYSIAQSTFALLKSHNFKPSALPKGIIHGDLHSQNILVHKNKIVAILDFEDAHIGACIYDLGFSILDTCWKKDSFSQKRIDIFLNAYERLRKITPKERKYLMDSVIFSGLYTFHFLIIKNGVGNKNNSEYYTVKRFLKFLEISSP